MMLEQLLSSGRGSSNYFPDSGPGIKTLAKGDLQLGYFGEVTTTELFSGTELMANVGLTATGNDVSTASTGWFKFAFKGKILYFARTQFRLLVSWNDLYNLGLIYGTKDTGTFPVGAGVVQYRPQRKIESGRSYYLIPRCADAFTTDPGRFSSAPMGDSQNTEWYQCMGRLQSGWGPADKWAAFAIGYVTYGSRYEAWSRTTRTEDVTNALTIGNSSYGYPTAQAKAGYAIPECAWRPVLELIPGTALMDPWNVRDQSYGTIPPAITTQYVSTPGLLSIKNAISVWPTKQPVISSWSYPLAVFNPLKPQGSANLGLNPFAVTGDGANLVSSPRNLVYKSTNLNPFAVAGSNIA